MFPCFKIEFFKFIKNPWGIFFGVLFPIAWTLVDGFVWGNTSITINGAHFKLINLLFPGLITLIMLSFSLNTISNALCMDRLEKRLKQLALTKITRWKYLGGLLWFNYTIFFIVFLIVFIMCITIFNLHVTFTGLVAILLLPIPIFSIYFFIAIFIASTSKNFRSNAFITILVFYVLIFMSGSTIPMTVFPSGMKIIQYILPSGAATLALSYLFNGLSTSGIWYIYLVMIAYVSLFGYLAWKKFEWQ